MHSLKIGLIYFIVLTIGCLFFIKSKVQVLNTNLMKINSEIIQEQENIHILQAELAYLSQPQLIESLAAKHLNLQIMNSNQMVNIEITQDSQLKIFERSR